MATRQQGAWTNWEHASTRKITWTELWKSEPARLKFLIQSVYDVIPCHPTCIAAAEQKHQHIGGTRGSLQHILNCCPEALGEGRYRWRHDQVLKAVADTVRIRIQQSRHQPPASQNITFIRAGGETSLTAQGSHWAVIISS